MRCEDLCVVTDGCLFVVYYEGVCTLSGSQTDKDNNTAHLIVKQISGDVAIIANSSVALPLIVQYNTFGGQASFDDAQRCADQCKNEARCQIAMSAKWEPPLPDSNPCLIFTEERILNSTQSFVAVNLDY